MSAPRTVREHVRYRGYDLYQDRPTGLWIATSLSGDVDDAGNDAFHTLRSMIAAIDATYETPGEAS